MQLLQQRPDLLVEHLAGDRADLLEADHAGLVDHIGLGHADGRVGIDYGVYGVPETYIVDKAGVIRFKQIGPVTREVLDKKIRPLVQELQR